MSRLSDDYTPSTGSGTSLPDQTGNAGKVLGTDGTDPAWVDSGGSSAPYGDYQDRANWTGLGAALGGGSGTVTLTAADYVDGDSDTAGTGVPVMSSDGTFSLPPGLYRLSSFADATAESAPAADSSPLFWVAPLALGPAAGRALLSQRQPIPDGSATDFVGGVEYLVAVRDDPTTVGPLAITGGEGLTLQFVEFQVTRVG